MGTVIQLRLPEKPVRHRPVAPDDATREAQILFFSGVRYSRRDKDLSHEREDRKKSGLKKTN